LAALPPLERESLLRLKTTCGARRLLKAVAMVGWSGAGGFEDLERTVVGKLSAGEGGTDHIGDALLVTARDPVAVARSLSFLPGVAWIAVGYRFSGTESYLKNLEILAKRYLSRGRKFRISAQVVASKQTAGDVVLAGNSELLSSIPGSRVDERKPHVTFRVCIQGARGACGAEIRRGPRGVPTNGDWVSCLVSGGERSSSLAWMAALSGFSLRLVHSRTDEVALRHVARLYSELSLRMDPRCLELVLLEGGDNTYGRVGGWLRDHKGAAFAGLRPGRSDALTKIAERFPNLALPLVLVQDDEIAAIYRSLGVGRAVERTGGLGITLKALDAVTPYSERRFGGVHADSNAVIDMMKRRP
jgi:hypothetical protein